MNVLDHPRTPVELLAAWWPHARVYRKELELVDSVRTATETFCVAGNKLGKDWTCSWIALSFFICPWLYFPVSYFNDIERKRAGRPFHLVHTRRVMTTSVTADHMRVLWGEIARWVATCRRPLLDLDITMVQHEIKLKAETSVDVGSNPMSYLRGQVIRQGPDRAGEGLAGHHAAYTLFIADECSGVPEASRTAAQGWAQKFVYIGNPNPCSKQHFFRKGVEGGDLLVA